MFKKSHIPNSNQLPQDSVLYVIRREEDGGMPPNRPFDSRERRLPQQNAATNAKRN